MEKWKQEISKIDVRMRGGADVIGVDEKRIRNEAIMYLQKVSKEMRTDSLEFLDLLRRVTYFLEHMDVGFDRVLGRLEGMRSDVLKYTKYQLETEKYRNYLENQGDVFEAISEQLEDQIKQISPLEQELGEKARSILDFYSAKNGWGLSQFLKDDRKSITYNEWETTLEILQSKRNAHEALRKIKKGFQAGKTLFEIKKDKIVSDFMDSPEGVLMNDMVSSGDNKQKLEIAFVRYLLNQARYMSGAGYGGDMIAQKYYAMVANLKEPQYQEFVQIAQKEKMGKLESFHRGTLTNLADTFLSLDQVAIMVAGGAAGKALGFLVGKSTKLAKAATVVGDVVGKSKTAKALVPGVKMISKTGAGWTALNIGLDVGKTIAVQWTVEKIWGKDAGKVAAAVLMFLPGAKSGFESQMSVNLAKDAKGMGEFAKWTIDKYGKEKAEQMIYEGMLETAKREGMSKFKLFKGLSADQIEKYKEGARSLADKLEELAIHEAKNPDSIVSGLERLGVTERIRAFRNSKPCSQMSRESAKQVEELLKNGDFEKAKQAISDAVKAASMVKVAGSEIFSRLPLEDQQKLLKYLGDGNLEGAKDFLKKRGEDFEKMVLEGLGLNNNNRLFQSSFNNRVMRNLNDPQIKKLAKALLEGPKKQNKIREELLKMIEDQLSKSLDYRKKMGEQMLASLSNNEKFKTLSNNPSWLPKWGWLQKTGEKLSGGAKLKQEIELACKEGRLLDAGLLVEKSGVEKGFFRKSLSFLGNELPQFIFAPIFLKRIYENPDDVKSWSDSLFEMFFFYAGAGAVEKAFSLLSKGASFVRGFKLVEEATETLSGVTKFSRGTRRMVALTRGTKLTKGLTEFVAVPLGGGAVIYQGEHILEGKFHMDKNVWKLLPEGRSSAFGKAWDSADAGGKIAYSMFGFMNGSMDKLTDFGEWIFGPVTDGIGKAPVVLYQTRVNPDVNPETFIPSARSRTIDSWNQRVEQYCDKIVRIKLQKLLSAYKHNISPFDKTKSVSNKRELLTKELDDIFRLKNKGFFESIKNNISETVNDFADRIDESSRSNGEMVIDDQYVSEKVSNIVEWMKQVMLINDNFIERRKNSAITEKRSMLQMVGAEEGGEKILAAIDKSKKHEGVIGTDVLGLDGCRDLIRRSSHDLLTREFLRKIVERTYSHEELLQNSMEKMQFNTLINSSLGDQFVTFLNMLTNNERTFNFISDIEKARFGKWQT